MFYSSQGWTRDDTGYVIHYCAAIHFFRCCVCHMDHESALKYSIIIIINDIHKPMLDLIELFIAT